MIIRVTEVTSRSSRMAATRPTPIFDKILASSASSLPVSFISILADAAYHSS